MKKIPLSKFTKTTEEQLAESVLKDDIFDFKDVQINRWFFKYLLEKDIIKPVLTSNTYETQRTFVYVCDGITYRYRATGRIYKASTSSKFRELTVEEHFVSTLAEEIRQEIDKELLEELRKLADNMPGIK